MKKVRNRIPLKLISIYQHSHGTNHIKKCRFIPTCSEYARISYTRYNFFYASLLTLWRLIRCNPFHKMAYDPVPLPRKYRTKYKTLEEALSQYRIENDF